MRRTYFWAIVLAVVLRAGVAQAAPKAEVFGGYQFTHLDGGPNLNGWNAALTGYLNSFLGITADLTGVYGSGLSFHTYTFGPEVAVHLPLVKPFAHVLVGGARASAGGVSSNGFDVYFGGGADVGHGLLAWRIAQFDWMVTRFSGFTDRKNVRFSTGLVLRF